MRKVAEKDIDRKGKKKVLSEGGKKKKNKLIRSISARKVKKRQKDDRMTGL
jgi:hypothetical protein